MRRAVVVQYVGGGAHWPPYDNMRLRGRSAIVGVALECRHRVTATRTTRVPLNNTSLPALSEPRVAFSRLASDDYPDDPRHLPTARLRTLPLLVAGVYVRVYHGLFIFEIVIYATSRRNIHQIRGLNTFLLALRCRDRCCVLRVAINRLGNAWT
jgi:hypothetical protein